MTKNKKIIFCQCGGERISGENKHLLKRHLQHANGEVVILSDLCSLAALEKNAVASLFDNEYDHLVVACYKRALKLLLSQCGVNSENYHIQYSNFLESEVQIISEEISGFTYDSSVPNSMRELTGSLEWPSWYPVIDYDRCTSCGQCADFCLFGVYSKADNRVGVVNPRGCKNNCPACARICPQTAIVFPKYMNGGAIGGSDRVEEGNEKNRQTKDINEILGSDIYAALEERKRKRRSIIQQEALRKAREEREQALGENKNQEKK